MRQEVNLFLPEFQEQKEWLTLATLASVSAGVIILLVIASVLLQRSVDVMQNTVTIAESQMEAQKKRIEKLRQMPRPANAMNLDAKLRRLQMAIESRRRVGRIIEGQNLGNADGFRESMAALAAHSRGTIQLNKFRFSDGGRRFEMAGVTRSSKDVPLYIKALKQSPDFTNTEFGLLVLGHQRQQGHYAFVLGYQDVDEPESPVSSPETNLPLSMQLMRLEQDL